MLLSRQDKINYIRNLFPENTKAGLEISPSIDPMIVPSDDYKIHYLDSCTTDKLKKRAIDNGRNPDCVPFIDFKYDFSKSIANCVDQKKFDFVVSSHVIEHVPDLISHFQQVYDVLRNGGIYGMLVPDKNLCFDVKKPVTTFGQLVEAYIEKRQHAPVSAIIDEYYYAVQKDGKPAWTDDDETPYHAKYPNSKKLISDVISNPQIVNIWDGHIWRFTPHSFQTLFTALQDFDLVRLTLCEVIPTSMMEFIVILKKP